MPCVLTDWFCKFSETLGILLQSFLTSFHSHNTPLPPTFPFLTEPFYSELPENICGFHAAPGALGIQLSEVCSLHWDCLETAEGPWNSPTFMPLNQSKPSFSFLLYPPLFLLLLWVTGVRQTCCVQVRAFVQACLRICTDECMCECAAASHDVHFICCVCMHILYVSIYFFTSVVYVQLDASGFHLLDPQPHVLVLSQLSAVPERHFFSLHFTFLLLFFIDIGT